MDTKTYLLDVLGELAIIKRQTMDTKTYLLDILGELVEKGITLLGHCIAMVALLAAFGVGMRIVVWLVTWGLE